MIARNGYIFLALAAALAAGRASLADTLYVRAGATGARSGGSWGDAFADLQAALVAADGRLAGDPKASVDVWVAGGTYTPSAVPDRAESFQLRSRVALYGGFAGKETSLDQRDIAGHETILSGDLNGDDGPPGTFINTGENSYHVVTALNVDDSARLDGFTIIGGHSDGPGYGATPLSQDQGSGGNVYYATPVFANCTFRANWARNHGAVNDHGSSTLINCLFEKNYASFGAGLYIHHPSMTMAIGCTFIDNTTPGNGGGAYSRSDMMAMLSNCTFIGNSADGGGGMYTDPDATTIIADCQFEQNTAAFGGGLYNDANTCVVTGCTFTNNTATQGGAAVYNINGENVVTGCAFTANSGDPVEDTGGSALWNTSGSPVVSDCTFEDNISPSGSAVYNGDGSLATVVRCTFARNHSHEGSGVYNVFSDAVVKDCTFVDNTVDGGAFPVGGAISSYYCHPIVSRCVFERNSAELGGGAIYNEGEHSDVTNCVFRANGAHGPTEGWGGAVLNSFEVHAVLANCEFDGNHADIGGAIYNTVFSSVDVINCTFSGNNADGRTGDFGGAVFNGSSREITLTNCIAWGDAPDEIEGVSPLVSHCCVQGGWPGVGNLAADPRFAFPLGPDGLTGTADDDLRLLRRSPCIDAGDAAALPPDTADLDGDGDVLEPIPLDLANLSRIAGPAPDLGAWEYYPRRPILAPTDTTPRPPAQSR